MEIIEDFRETTLHRPLQEGHQDLSIVAGYVSSAAARQQLTGGSEGQFPKIPESGLLRIVYGMYPEDGVRHTDHQQFIKLQEEFPNFHCYYAVCKLPVHSKVYVWRKDGEPSIAFLGSANFSNRATHRQSQEALTQCDPIEAHAYFEKILGYAVRCDLLKEVTFCEISRKIKTVNVTSAVPESLLSQARFVDLPLTVGGRGLEVPKRSGLNWGQRPEEAREPNQAYIAVPAEVQRSGFFPERGEYFTVLTDDGQTFMMSRNQESGKALHTPNNSDIGRYFRHRLGVNPGAMVTIGDLMRYRRLTVRFYDLGDDTYFADFSN